MQEGDDSPGSKLFQLCHCSNIWIKFKTHRHSHVFIIFKNILQNCFFWDRSRLPLQTFGWHSCTLTSRFGYRWHHGFRHTVKQRPQGSIAAFIVILEFPISKIYGTYLFRFQPCSWTLIRGKGFRDHFSVRQPRTCPSYPCSLK